MFKTHKVPVTPGFRPGFDLPATGKYWNRGQIVERTYDLSHRSYDWSPRSCVIARAVVTWSLVMLKTYNLRFQLVWCYDWSYDRSHDATIDHAIDRCTPRLIVLSVFGCHDWSYALSQDATSARTIGRRMQRSIDRTIGRRPSWLIVHCALIATTSRTTAYDGSCRRYSPIARESATKRRDRSRYAPAAGDRSKHCRSVALWPNRNQSYEPEIVRSGVTGFTSMFFVLDVSLSLRPTA